jgi:hypothetical protein
MMSENNNPETAPCYFCGQQVDVNEYKCYGCDDIICDDCADPECDPRGDHHPEDHRTDAD